MTDPVLDLLGDLVDYQAKDPQQALDSALAAVRSYCGWHIATSVTETVNVWALDGRGVVVETLNLTGVTSVVQDSVTVDPASYTFEPYGVIRRTVGGYFSTLTRVAVTFTHGYSALPDDVREVVLTLAQRSINDTRGMVPRAGSGQSVVLVESSGSQLTGADKEKLGPYVVTAGFA